MKKCVFVYLYEINTQNKNYLPQMYACLAIIRTYPLHIGLRHRIHSGQEMQIYQGLISVL